LAFSFSIVQHSKSELESPRAGPADIFGVLALLCLGASSAADTYFPFRGNSDRLGANLRGRYFPAALVYFRRAPCPVCICLGFALLRRTQSSSIIRSSVVVMACRSEDGSASPYWADESGSAAVCGIGQRGNIALNAFCAENYAVDYSMRPAITWLPLVRISIAIGGRIADPCVTWPRTNPPAEFVPNRDRSKTVRLHGSPIMG